MIGGEGADADEIDVLLQRQRYHSLYRLPRGGVDDLHARIPQEGRDQTAAPVVSVETDLCDQYLGRMSLQ